MSLLLELFWSFFQIGLFSIGGGYAALPLIQYQIVEHHGWLSLSQFTDLITIAEMTPGPIALNASTFVGTQVAGLAGAITATVGCVTPSLIIVSIMAFIYQKYKNLGAVQGVLDGLRPAVVALIGSAGAAILLLALFGEQGFSLAGLNPVSLLLIAAGFFILRKWKPNPIVIILGCGVVGGAYYLLV